MASTTKEGRVQARLDAETADALTDAAMALGVSTSTIVRWAVTEWLTDYQSGPSTPKTPKPRKG